MIEPCVKSRLFNDVHEQSAEVSTTHKPQNNQTRQLACVRPLCERVRRPLGHCVPTRMNVIFRHHRARAFNTRQTTIRANGCCTSVNQTRPLESRPRARWAVYIASRLSMPDSRTGLPTPAGAVTAPASARRRALSAATRVGGTLTCAGPAAADAAARAAAASAASFRSRRRASAEASAGPGALPAAVSGGHGVTPGWAPPPALPPLAPANVRLRGCGAAVTLPSPLVSIPRRLGAVPGENTVTKSVPSPSATVAALGVGGGARPSAGPNGGG